MDKHLTMCAFLAPFARGCRPPAQRPARMTRVTCSANRRGRPPASARPFVSVVASGALRLLIEAVLTRADGLHVSVDASSNLALLGGDIAGIEVAVDALELNDIVVSGGVRLSTGRLRLVRPETLLAPPRLADPIAVSVSATLTEADLNREGPVRSGLDALFRLVLDAVLAGAAGLGLPRGVGPQCRLDYARLDDAPSVFRPDSPIRGVVGLSDGRRAPGRLVLESHVVLDGGRRLNFAVRGQLAADGDGTVVKMVRPELLWRRFAVPIVVVESVGVQLMPLTKVSRLEIFDQRLSVDGVVIVRREASEDAKWLRPGNKR